MSPWILFDIHEQTIDTSQGYVDGSSCDVQLGISL